MRKAGLIIGVVVFLSQAAFAQDAEIACDRLSLGFSVDGYERRCWLGQHTPWAETGYASVIVEKIRADGPDGAFLIVHQKPGDPFSSFGKTTVEDVIHLDAFFRSTFSWKEPVAIDSFEVRAFRGDLVDVGESHCFTFIQHAGSAPAFAPRGYAHIVAGMYCGVRPLGEDRIAELLGHVRF